MSAEVTTNGSDRRGAASARGFTLLELLIALSIMTAAMAVVIATFVVTIRAWRRGSDMLDELHHGDFVMEQLVSSLRSTAFFYNKPEQYGFWLEDKDNGDYPADQISFVTSGTAFVPKDSHLANGLHRLEITIEENEDGETGVAVRAFPHMVSVEDWEGDAWFVSSQVKGLDCRTFDLQEEEWDDDWEDTNAIPSLVEITLYMDPIEEGRDPITMSRVIEIPLAPVVANAVRFQEEDLEDLDAAAEEQAALDGEGGAVAEVSDPEMQFQEGRDPDDRRPAGGGR